LGIAAPKVTTGREGKRTYLLVQRYDRTNSGDRRRRLHQEDFCQGLGKPPSAEFNQTGIPGLSLNDMFGLARQHLPPTDIVRLLDIVVLHVLACNTDVQAKNYSVMLRGNGASLAPMYDVICGAVWGMRYQVLCAEDRWREPGRKPRRQSLAATSTGMWSEPKADL
jgi:serine/threonine-protein kinase HipA